MELLSFDIIILMNMRKLSWEYTQDEINEIDCTPKTKAYRGVKRPAIDGYVGERELIRRRKEINKQSKQSLDRILAKYNATTRYKAI